MPSIISTITASALTLFMASTLTNANSLNEGQNNITSCNEETTGYIDSISSTKSGSSNIIQIIIKKTSSIDDGYLVRIGPDIDTGAGSDLLNIAIRAMATSRLVTIYCKNGVTSAINMQNHPA